MNQGDSGEEELTLRACVDGDCGNYSEGAASGGESKSEFLSFFFVMTQGVFWFSYCHSFIDALAFWFPEAFILKSSIRVCFTLFVSSCRFLVFVLPSSFCFLGTVRTPD